MPDTIHTYDVYLDGRYYRDFLLRDSVCYEQALNLINQHQGF